MKNTRKNIKQKLKNNIRWIALKTGKTNKQVMNDIQSLDNILKERQKNELFN
jgi:hypothetical protein